MEELLKSSSFSMRIVFETSMNSSRSSSGANCWGAWRARLDCRSRRRFLSGWVSVDEELREDAILRLRVVLYCNRSDLEDQRIWL